MDLKCTKFYCIVVGSLFFPPPPLSTTFFSLPRRLVRTTMVLHSLQASKSERANTIALGSLLALVAAKDLVAEHSCATRVAHQNVSYWNSPPLSWKNERKKITIVWQKQNERKNFLMKKGGVKFQVRENRLQWGKRMS